MASNRPAASSPTARTLKVVFCGDFPVGSEVKICGGAAELGDWKVDNAPLLSVDPSSGRYVGSISLTKAGVPLTQPLTVEYKMVVRAPGIGAADQASGKPGPWTWQPGPNRRAIFPATFATAKQPTAPYPIAAAAEAVLSPDELASTQIAQETWYHSRDGGAVVDSDGWLEPNKGHLQHRYHSFNEALIHIEGAGGGLDRFSRGYEYFGFTRGYGPSNWSAKVPSANDAVNVSPTGSPAVPGIWYREWAPAARDAFLMGDFNGWNDSAHQMKKDEFGVFSLFLADNADGSEAIKHNTYLKLSLVLPDGSRGSRVPAWIRYAVYDPKLNEYVAKYWNPPIAERHSWETTRIRTASAADYTAVPGCAPCPLPSYSDWLGKAPRLTGLVAGAGSQATSSTAAAAVPAGGQPSPRTAYQQDPARAGLRIYEAHIGMSSAEGKVSSYREFADTVLPRVQSLGYNCVQFMAIMEHSYYGSFGYHVNQFVAPSSRFGTPEDLKYLVDKGHKMGLLIIMDCVHSHANKNVNDGLNNFDGTDYQYFHSGAKGNHDLWDSRLFDYSKFETQRLLLSSLRLFVEEYRFDGFRFDGVTSMMYFHHGLSFGFSGDYREYFGDHTDLTAVVYLMLANHMLHSLSVPALSIAEDVSGMPTLCRPVWEGGVGFDYRLGMAIPDKWIQFLKEKSDDEWNMEQLVWTLTNRRWQEKTITYAESHDQALVGDKTTAFWLMDKEMYWHMSAAEQPRHPVIDRGLALHKMIRLLTYALGGEGYLNFMGNEWGHPEWIDFPRQGNNWSYQHCRRQWNLVDDDKLLYKPLNNFDGAMHKLEEQFPWLLTRDNYVSCKNQSDKLVAFDRWTRDGPLVFIFNFNPTQSFTDYRIGVPCMGDWVIALDSDWKEFAGYERVNRDSVFKGQDFKWGDRPASVQVYTPSRTVLVLKLRK